MGKYLSVIEAKKILNEAKTMNPGGWVDHSENVGYVAGKIAEALGENKDKAEAFGYIHDIGRRVGRCSLKHIYEGYKYLNSLGYDDAARICLTHSFFENETDSVIGEWDIKDEERDFIKNYIENTEFNIYDKIVQLSDCICLSSGITILERRMVDVFFRYGFDEYVERNLKTRLNLQREIEEKLGYSIYKLFPNEIIDNLTTQKLVDCVKLK